MRAVLHVVHKKRPKMVGKCFDIPTSDGLETIFCHETRSSQFHRVTNSPGGIDADVIDYLIQAEIDVVHHIVRDTNTLLVAAVEDIFRYGIRATYDERDRLYLPLPMWTVVSEGPWYTIPFIHGQDVTLPLAERPTPRRVDPKRPAQPEQLGMFAQGERRAIGNEESDD